MGEITTSQKFFGMIAIVGMIVTAGCSSGGSTSHPGTSKTKAGTNTSVTFPNPVTLVVKATATPPVGSVNGELGFGGTFKVATGDYPNGQSITVKTFKTKVDQQSDLDASAQQVPQDGSATVYSTAAPWFVIYIDTTMDPATGGDAPFQPSPDIIASFVGGTVLAG